MTHASCGIATIFVWNHIQYARFYQVQLPMRFTCDFRFPHDEVLFVLYPNSCSAPEPCSGRHHCQLGELMVEKTKNNIHCAFKFCCGCCGWCFGWRLLATAMKSYFVDIVELFGLITCGTLGRLCHGETHSNVSVIRRIMTSDMQLFEDFLCAAVHLGINGVNNKTRPR